MAAHTDEDQRALMAAAQAGDERAFRRLVEPHRRPLEVHCYRMLGSVQDAEDLVQETYLRAWRGYGGFEGRSSLRFWLYRIATSACLTALGHRSRRVVPAGLGAPSDDPHAPLGTAGPETGWVQPMADAVPPDPAAVVAERGSVRLALIVALQYLPPRQRAVLILRDVLSWRAAEVAALLGTSTTAVNSALRRARERLEQAGVDEDAAGAAEGGLDARGRALVDSFAMAFQHADMDALAALLREDVTLEMPPEPLWFAGRDMTLRFLAERVFPSVGEQRAVGLTVNGGQPALALYSRRDTGVFLPHALQTLTLREGGVAGLLVFRDLALFRTAGLPELLPADTQPGAAWRS
jgi:RNA polymerase sigma-70 factor, ECF subfamily